MARRGTAVAMVAAMTIFGIASCPISAAAAATEPVLVIGTAVDASGQPLIDATVVLVLPTDTSGLAVGATFSDQPIASTASGSNGSFEFDMSLADLAGYGSFATGNPINFEITVGGGTESTAQAAEESVIRIWTGSSWTADGPDMSQSDAAVSPVQISTVAVTADHVFPVQDGRHSLNVVAASAPDYGCYTNSKVIYTEPTDYTQLAQMFSWTDMSVEFEYGVDADTSFDVGFSLSGDVGGFESKGSVNIDTESSNGGVAVTGLTSKGEANAQGTFEYQELAKNGIFTYKGVEYCGRWYVLQPVKWDGGLVVGSTLNASGAGCNMSVDNHREEYNRGDGHYFEKSQGSDHSMTASVDVMGFSFEAKSGYSTHAKMKWIFGISGGTTNNYDYLCWIASDPSVITAGGNIYAYSSNSNLGVV